MSALGQWPWPRTVLADMLARIYEMQAVVGGFDVVFPEPDRASPAEAVKHFRNVDQGTRELLAHLPSNDDVFARAIGEGKVVLGQSGTHTSNTRAPGQHPETGVATMGPDPMPFLISYPYLLRNLPELEQAAAGRGLFSIRPERDGIVRRVLATSLRAFGYEVIEADRGDSALEIVRKQGEQLDLVVSDVVMPGLRGDVLAAEVARVVPGLGVLLMSGYAADLDVANLGPHVAWVDKPVSGTELRRRIGELVSSARARAASARSGGNSGSGSLSRESSKPK